MIKKNENENVQDSKHIDINNNILMKIHAISCIGTFYSFVAMITITLNKFFGIMGISYVQMQCQFEYVLVSRYIFNE